MSARFTVQRTPTGRYGVLDGKGELRIVFQGGHAFGVADEEVDAEHVANRLNAMSAAELRQLAPAARKAAKR